MTLPPARLSERLRFPAFRQHHLAIGGEACLGCFARKSKSCGIFQNLSHSNSRICLSLCDEELLFMLRL